MEQGIKKNSLALLEEKPWYKEGLRFKCTGCGKCCQGPGYVWVGTEEIERLAKYFKVEPSLFIKKFTRRIGERIALVDAPHSD